MMMWMGYANKLPPARRDLTIGPPATIPADIGNRMRLMDMIRPGRYVTSGFGPLNRRSRGSQPVDAKSESSAMKRIMPRLIIKADLGFVRRVVPCAGVGFATS